MCRNIFIYSLLLSLILPSTLFASRSAGDADIEMALAMQDNDPDALFYSLDSGNDSCEYEYEYVEESDISENQPPRKEALPYQDEKQQDTHSDLLLQADLEAAWLHERTINDSDITDDEEKGITKRDIAFWASIFSTCVIGGGTLAGLYSYSNQYVDNEYSKTLNPMAPNPCSKGKNVCDYLRSQNGTFPQGRVYIPDFCACGKKYFRTQNCYLPGDPNITHNMVEAMLINMTEEEAASKRGFVLNLRRHNNYTVCDPLPKGVNSNVTSTPSPTSTQDDDMPDLVDMTTAAG